MHQIEHSAWFKIEFLASSLQYGIVAVKNKKQNTFNRLGKCQATILILFHTTFLYVPLGLEMCSGVSMCT